MVLSFRILLGRILVHKQTADAFRISPFIGIVCDQLEGTQMQRECNPMIENSRLSSLKQVRRHQDIIRDKQDAFRLLS
jgi:hypothetical protein